MGPPPPVSKITFRCLVMLKVLPLLFQLGSYRITLITGNSVVYKLLCIAIYLKATFIPGVTTLCLWIVQPDSKELRVYKPHFLFNS